MNEANTRAHKITPQLEAAGWVHGAEDNQVLVHHEYPIKNDAIKAHIPRVGTLKADYILEYRGVKLAAVEAKSDELNVSEGVAQAKLYAQKLDLKTSFATNGKEIYEINHLAGTEGKIEKFPSPEELWERTFAEANEWMKRFAEVPFEKIGDTKKAHYYQEVAVNRVMKAIADDKKRILLTLATGTGKTFIAFQVAWKIFQSGWTGKENIKRRPRILFLTDRNNLADQAYGGFSAFKEDAMERITPGKVKQRGEVPKNASVFITIFQTFMGGKGPEPYYKQYEPDFFDLIIIDECHRGGAKDESAWREVLEYFSGAVHLGLTATPKREKNLDTYDYFGEPVYSYSLNDGIQEGYLTPYKAIEFQTTIDDYVYRVDDEVEEGEVDERHTYIEEDFNKIIEIEARERLRVREMLKAINRGEKTIVFCANQAHAAKIRDFINEELEGVRGDYCVRVTADDKVIGDHYLETFRDNSKTIPTIVTTSQKLTTGVDVQNVRNIVLLRPIKSMIQFKQIIGRGTRLFDGKNYFTILDFVGAHKHFSDPEWDGDPLPPETDDKTSEAPDSTKNNGDEAEGEEKPKKEIIRIKISVARERELQVMRSVLFSVEGKMVPAEIYLNYLFSKAKLPEILKSEEKLRDAWSNPGTRRDLLTKLEDVGCGEENLKNLQKLIEAEDSDLFDVLAYIAYEIPPITRIARVEKGREKIFNLLNEKQRTFVNYVLEGYLTSCVSALDIEKFTKILDLNYSSFQDAKQELGDLQSAKQTFIDFQQHLYKEAA